MTRSTKFQLSLFGGFDLKDVQGRSVDPGPRKLKAMLSWLAIHPDIEHPREKLASLFWPDSEPEVARHSLRQALGSLRKVMPAESSPIRASKETIFFDSDLIDVDALAFDAALAEVGEVQAAEQITQLYRGEFLAGCNPKSDLFDEWLGDHRSHYRERATNAMCQRLTSLIDRRIFEDAIPIATRLINIDPLRESAYRGLMMAHIGLGNNALALRWYRRCEKSLLAELNVLPCLETRALHAHILNAGNGEEEQRKLQRDQLKVKQGTHRLLRRARQRTLYQAESAIEGILDRIGGQSILVRGKSEKAINSLIEQIIELAEPQGFKVCRGAVPEKAARTDSKKADAEKGSENCESLMPESFHSQSLEGSACCFQKTSEQSPVLLVLENVHAAGTATLEKIGRMISAVGEASVLLVMTSHYGGEPTDQAWRGAMSNAPLTTIDLVS